MKKAAPEIKGGALTYSGVINEKWSQLDSQSKAELVEQFHKDMEKFNKDKEDYFNSLTEEQKLKLAEAKSVLRKEKSVRKLKNARKENDIPVKPPNSYGFYFRDEIATNKYTGTFGENSKRIAAQWKEVGPQMKSKYEEIQKAAVAEYHEKMRQWEEKMIREEKQSLILKTSPSNVVSVSRAPKSPPVKESKPMAIQQGPSSRRKHKAAPTE
jgi:hypothetical protein